MANKFFLVCATLALCFLLINASSYRTIVEFDEDDDTNPSGPSRQQRCRKEFQQEKHLHHCQRWMRWKSRQSLSGGLPLNDDKSENPQLRPLGLEKCCSELHQEDTVCVCPTLRQAAKAVDLEGESGPYETSKIYTTAKVLPYICRIPQVGICPFRSPDSPYY